MYLFPLFAFLMFIFWLSDRLSQPKPKPYVEPWYRGISTEELIGLYDSCDILVFGRIENLDNIDVERTVMGGKHDLVEVHLDVRVELPENLRNDNVVINSCYFMQQGRPALRTGNAGVHPEVNDKICLGLFMRAAKNGVFYLGSNNPFYRIRNDQWLPYVRRRWIDLIPSNKPIMGDHTHSGASIH